MVLDKREKNDSSCRVFPSIYLPAWHIQRCQLSPPGRPSECLWTRPYRVCSFVIGQRETPQPNQISQRRKGRGTFHVFTFLFLSHRPSFTPSSPPHNVHPQHPIRSDRHRCMLFAPRCLRIRGIHRPDRRHLQISHQPGNDVKNYFLIVAILILVFLDGRRVHPHSAANLCIIPFSPNSHYQLSINQ